MHPCPFGGGRGIIEAEWRILRNTAANKLSSSLAPARAAGYNKFNVRMRKRAALRILAENLL